MKAPRPLDPPSLGRGRRERHRDRVRLKRKVKRPFSEGGRTDERKYCVHEKVFLNENLAAALGATLIREGGKRDNWKKEEY